MLRGRLAVVLAVMLVAVPPTGCLEDEAGVPSHILVQGSQPLVARDWAPDGQRVVETEGQARLIADNETGTGSLTANWTLEGSTFEVSADTFEPRPGEPWTGNGVNRSVDVHGGTGRGTGELPRVSVLTATWAPVVLTRGGEIVPDPLTGESELAGHTFLTEEGVRSDETRELRAEASSGDAELHLVLTSDPGGPVYEDEHVEEQGSFEPPASNASVPFTLRQTSASANVTVAVEPPAGQLTPAEVNASLVSPEGDTLRQTTLGVQGNETVEWSLEAPPATGNYSVELDSQGSASWNVTAAVDHPDPFFLHVTYEEVDWRTASE